MRVASPCQLPLDVPEFTTPADHWRELPQAAQGEALVLLARLIARGVMVETADAAEEAGDER